MAFAENLHAFLSVADFAVEALYNGATTVVGIFDKAYLEPLGEPIESSSPQILCAHEDVPSVAHGDTFEVDGDTYTVVGVEPDGTGMVLIRLQVSA